jgi:hypothetical protein
MILIPILMPVLAGMLIAVVAVAALGVLLLGTLVSGLVTGGTSVLRAHRRARAELSVIEPTGVSEEEEVPQAA